MPKGVPHKVTIGNLENELNALSIRCDQLFAERNSLRNDAIALQDSLTLAEESLARVQEAYTRLQGWQDLAREIFEKRNDQ